MLDLISKAAVVGFSGGRDRVASGFHLAAENVRGQVFVGCASGLDAAVRSHFPEARVFHAADFGEGRQALARRSIAFVNALAVADGLLLAFPSRPCPAGIVPAATSSQCFCGGGSGTWATLAYAIGLGCECLVFLESLPVPAWGLLEVGAGWWSNSISYARLNAA